jgi:hypothetical protein
MSLNGVRENVDDVLLLVYKQIIRSLFVILTVKLDE